MEKGIRFTREFSGTKGMGARLVLQEYTDPENNTHKLEILEFSLCSQSYSGITYYLGSPENSGSICIDDLPLVTFRNLAGSHGVTPGEDYTPVALEKAESGVFGGNDDGTAACRLTVDVYGYSVTGGGANGFRLQLSETLTLTTLPRGSAVAATDACIGSVSILAITPRRQNVTHSLLLSFGDFSAYVTEGGALSQGEQIFSSLTVPFPIPEDFYEQIPEKPAEKAALRCKTYENGALLGETDTTFTVTADPALCGPLLSADLEDTDPAVLALTGDPGVFVPGYSDLLCRVTAAARYGAALREVRVDDTLLTGETLLIPNGSRGRFYVTAKDSRGYVTEQEVALTRIPYVPLTLHGWVRRLDQTGGQARLCLGGSFYGGTFGAADNTLTLSCRIDGGEALLLEPTVTETDFSLDTVLSGLSYDRSHSLLLTARDALGEVTCTLSVQKGIPVFDWGEGDFAFHVPVALAKGFSCPKETFLAAYPVGAVFLSTRDSDPSVFFGGSWKKLEETNLPFYGWQRQEDTSGRLGTGILGSMILSKED